MKLFVSLVLAAATLVSSAAAFPISIGVDNTGGNSLVKPNGSPLQQGEFTVRVGYFNFNANYALNNAAIAANAGNQAALEAAFVNYFTFDAPQQAQGDTGAFGDVNGLVGPAGVFYAYLEQENTTYNGGSNSGGFVGRNIYAWIQLSGDPTTQLIASNGLARFPVQNDPINAASSLQIAENAAADIIVGNDRTAGASNDYQLVAGNSTPVVSFNPMSVTVSEAAGNAGLTVTRTGAPTGTITVSFTTTAATAAAGTDYTTTAGTLTFGPNVTSQPISVPILNRAGLQGDRSLTVVLSGAVGGDIGAGTATVTIQDTVNRGQLSFTAANYVVAEGNAGTANAMVKVQRTGGADGAIGATLSTADQTAVSSGGGADFAALAQTVSFADLETGEKTVLVAVNGDTTFEADETFQVNLTAPTGGATIGATATATVTITNDDMAPNSGTISLDAATFAGPESGSIAITATRTGGNLGALSVHFATTDGTALAGTDYTATNGTLTFANGESGQKTILVPILADSLFEPGETFTLTLSSPSVAGALQAPASAVVTITNDDPPRRGRFAFSAPNYTGREVDGTAAITVLRTNGADVAAEVGYSLAGGTATATADYTPTSGTLSFAAGELSKSFNVTIVNDPLIEADETVNLALANPVVAGDNTDTDNDGMTDGQEALAGTNALDPMSVLRATIAVSGNDVLVSFPSVAGRIYTIECSPTMNGGTWTPAVSGIAGTGAVVTQRIVGALLNPCGFFRATVAAGAPSMAVLTIISDDVPATFRFAAASYTADEGAAPTTITVLRTGALDQTLSVNVATSNGTAGAGSDFTAVSRTLTFAPNDTEESFTVQALNDTTPEAPETFAVSLSRVIPGDPSIDLVSPATAQVVIARSDAIDRPDNLVAVQGGSFAGNNVYNSSGDAQIASKSVGGSSTATFTLRVQNDGNVLDSFLVRGVSSGTAGNKGSVRYFRNGSEITVQIVGAGGYLVSNLNPGNSADVEVQVRFSGAQSFTGYGATLTTTSVGTPATSDVARVVGIVQ